MKGTHKMYTLIVTAMLVVSVVGIGAVAGAATTDGFSVAVEQDDGVTVTVTNNSSAVAGADVNVTATNGSYAGTGDHVTDENGTVSLPAPEENVTITVTASYNNSTATTTVDLVAAESGEDDSFGQLLSSLIHGGFFTASDGEPIGQNISDWVIANNPGNASEHVPDDKGPGAHAAGNGSQGPPEHAGPPAKSDDDETTPEPTATPDGS